MCSNKKWSTLVQVFLFFNVTANKLSITLKCATKWLTVFMLIYTTIMVSVIKFTGKNDSRTSTCFHAAQYNILVVSGKATFSSNIFHLFSVFQHSDEVLFLKIAINVIVICSYGLKKI